MTSWATKRKRQVHLTYYSSRSEVSTAAWFTIISTQNPEVNYAAGETYEEGKGTTYQEYYGVNNNGLTYNTVYRSETSSMSYRNTASGTIKTFSGTRSGRSNTSGSNSGSNEDTGESTFIDENYPESAVYKVTNNTYTTAITNYASNIGEAQVYTRTGTDYNNFVQSSAEKTVQTSLTFNVLNNHNSQDQGSYGTGYFAIPFYYTVDSTYKTVTYINNTAVSTKITCTSTFLTTLGSGANITATTTTGSCMSLLKLPGTVTLSKSVTGTPSLRTFISIYTSLVGGSFATEELSYYQAAKDEILWKVTKKNLLYGQKYLLTEIAESADSFEISPSDLVKVPHRKRKEVAVYEETFIDTFGSNKLTRTACDQAGTYNSPPRTSLSYTQTYVTRQTTTWYHNILPNSSQTTVQGSVSGKYFITSNPNDTYSQVTFGIENIDTFSTRYITTTDFTNSFEGQKTTINSYGIEKFYGPVSTFAEVFVTNYKQTLYSPGTGGDTIVNQDISVDGEGFAGDYPGVNYLNVNLLSFNVFKAKSQVGINPPVNEFSNPKGMRALSVNGQVTVKNITTLQIGNRYFNNQDLKTPLRASNSYTTEKTSVFASWSSNTLFVTSNYPNGTSTATITASGIVTGFGGAFPEVLDIRYDEDDLPGYNLRSVRRSGGFEWQQNPTVYFSPGLFRVGSCDSNGVTIDSKIVTRLKYGSSEITNQDKLTIERNVPYCSVAPNINFIPQILALKKNDQNFILRDNLDYYYDYNGRLTYQ